MRVVFLTQRYWPAVGGVEKYVHRLCQALIELGHQPRIVTGAHVRGLAQHEVHDGVEVHRFGAHRSPARAWCHLMKLRPVFAGADVIHISDTAMLEYFYRMVGWTIPSKPLFLTRHGMSYICPVPALEKARARRTLKLVDGIIHDGCFIEKWLGVEPDCVPNQGIYPEADDLHEIPEPPPTSAVFVGRLEPDSGIQIYVDAIAVLKERYKRSIALEVYGDGTLMGGLRAQAKLQRLPITFRGWQADAQERITDGCFAFIDGRMAMQEAMARRRLVVAAYVDPLKRDYINGEPFSGYLVSGGDAESIASLVNHYAGRTEERKRLIERAFSYARTLSWKRTAGEYLKLWQEAPRLRTQGRFVDRARLARRFSTEARTSVSAMQV